MKNDWAIPMGPQVSAKPEDNPRWDGEKIRPYDAVNPCVEVWEKYHLSAKNANQGGVTINIPPELVELLSIPTRKD
jgi:hypothetical protein